jgi:hypothetical protein
MLSSPRSLDADADPEDLKMGHNENFNCDDALDMDFLHIWKYSGESRMLQSNDQGCKRTIALYRIWMTYLGYGMILSQNYSLDYKHV